MRVEHEHQRINVPAHCILYTTALYSRAKERQQNIANMLFSRVYLVLCLSLRADYCVPDNDCDYDGKKKTKHIQFEIMQKDNLALLLWLKLRMQFLLFFFLLVFILLARLLPWSYVRELRLMRVEAESHHK